MLVGRKITLGKAGSPVLQCGEESPFNNRLHATANTNCCLSVKPQCELDKVLQAFAEACKYINSTVSPNITNKNRIQKEVYRAVR
jgi:hypothetical protein